MTITGFIGTVALAALVALVTMQKHAGVILVLLVPLIVVYQLVRAYRARRDPVERRKRWIRMAIWATAIGFSAVTHWYWVQASRADADKVVEAIKVYKAKAGTYPATLKDVGLDADALRREWRIIYAVIENRPQLLYASTFMPFDMFRYDFDHSAWKYRPG